MLATTKPQAGNVGAKPFLITGLPRSRTAWLSVFMSGAGSICYHEPIGGIREVSDIEAIYKSDYYKFVGIADSGLGFFLDWILKNIQPRTLIVERDPAEVIESLARLGLPRTNFTELLSDRLQPFKEHPLVMWVPYEALNMKRVMQKIYWHLMPGQPFDEERYELLAKMHIETDVEETLVQARKNKKNLDFLLRDIIPLVKTKENPNARNLH